ncbi:FG-GAP-like repeat-containing protein [Pelagicoccus sp. SDUM812003]|uniref:FG-GAP-like repeat-containing protein n=1 Tax=Pelagicoccus sp. SDUM812003 TaxID=3041267 RepID=UPI00280E1533|nr:FG-GAP-like repeat-containing protein [Pelagicoccus sp. SDUM812003]MDQ8203905.1 FG-GAP-like repeat-containing protein [Pelagicoccus sp. SDUM812003]
MKKIVFLSLGLAASSSLFAQIETLPFAPRSQAEGDTLFTRISAEKSGLQIENRYDDPQMWGDLYNEFQGGAVGVGIAAGDVDGDGLVDLYVASKTAPNKLFKQVAPFQFIDASESANAPGGETWSTGVTFADVDNDGDLDIYACQFGAANKLYLNDGSGSFTEAAAAAGIDIASGSVVGAFEDYDRDGDLDLFLLTNVLDATGAPEGEPDYLYRNNGDGTFTNVTAEAGIADDRGKGHSATWWDADGDGWADLFISNDFEGSDHLYRNNGDGTFTDVIDTMFPHTAWYSMGSDFGDINNDGRLDLFSADMANTTHYKSKVTMGDMGGWVDYFDTLNTPQYMKNAVFVNSGTHRFLEVAKMTGLSSTDWTWSPRLEDFDNDGWLDLHVTNGMVRSFTDSDMVNKIKTLKSKRQIVALVKNSPVLKEQNLAFRNDGSDTLHFSKVTKEWGLAHDGVSFGSVAADFDNDGDLDLAYTNFEETVSLYRNDSQNNSLQIELDGRQSNRFGIGAQVFVESSQGKQARKLTVARGALSSSQPIAHFGLGQDETVAAVTVRWPSGAEQRFENVSANQKLRIQEPDTLASPDPVKPLIKEVKGLFADRASDLGIDFTRTEQTFNDMDRQPLLPHRMNTLGGGIAIADVDGDDDSDIYFSGAAGQAGALFLNDGNGKYKMDTRAQPWSGKIQSEEMNPLFVDVNQDGSLDLYITSGSVEALEPDEALKDSLYLNQGDGRFTEVDATAFNPAPRSASVATAADFDRDGDLDLFVGGRVIPGEYPRAPQSQLLVNDAGTLTEKSFELAPTLADSGMVTSAIWSDVNGDDWVDLLVVSELDAPRLFSNQGGKLSDVSEKAGLSELKGWWNSIASADVDNDGDLDYVLGNLGKNTKYKASKAHPFKIFFNDFEGEGKCNIVEAKFEGDTLLPVRGRSCSSRAMPSIAKKFPTYHDFGSARLDAVYAPEKLQSSLLKEATELHSGILINDGSGKFEFRFLPAIAQISPVYGIGASDFDGDGNIDLVLAQNFNGPQVETGRYNGGIGLLLLGDGTGAFKPVEANDSGILIEDEARGIAIADLNLDGWADFLATRPNHEARAYLNQGSSGKNSLSLRLKGSQQANPCSVGTKLVVEFADGRKQAHEIASTSGYLSQSEAGIFVGYSEGNSPVAVHITWPDGSKSRQTLPLDQSRLTISQSESLAASR